MAKQQRFDTPCVAPAGGNQRARSAYPAPLYRQVTRPRCRTNCPKVKRRNVLHPVSAKAVTPPPRAVNCARPATCIQSMGKTCDILPETIRLLDAPAAGAVECEPWNTRAGAAGSKSSAA
jgi:hypothetical protein